MCLLETMLLIYCLFFPGIILKKNDERTIGCKVSKGAKIRNRYNQVPKSAVANITIRSTKFTQQSPSKGIYSHLLVSKGKGR